MSENADIDGTEPPGTANDGAATAARQRWMGVLARAATVDLEAAFAALAPVPDYTLLRRPEPGLVMVRGRAGGTGGRFNLGEMTVTRCAVRLSDGVVGMAYVAGRAGRQAELAAVFDGLLQRVDQRASLEAAVIGPLVAKQQALRDTARRKAAATKVDFFTLVRGEDPK